MLVGLPPVQLHRQFVAVHEYLVLRAAVAGRQAEDVPEPPGAGFDVGQDDHRLGLHHGCEGYGSPAPSRRDAEADHDVDAWIARRDRPARYVLVSQATPYSHTAPAMLVPARKTRASVELTTSLRTAAPNAPT